MEYNVQPAPFLETYHFPLLNIYVDLCCFICSLHQVSDHRAIYTAGFLLFRGCDNAAATGRERPGLDTGSPSQVTTPLLKVFRSIHPTSCLSLLINTAVIFTIELEEGVQK